MVYHQPIFHAIFSVIQFLFASYAVYLQILIFPEGTNLTAETKQSSDRYADKSGLAKLQYVLHPRQTGFTCITDFLKQR